MLEMSKELYAKLVQAQSTEEVAGLLKADGREISEEELRNIWKEIEAHRAEHELSTEELEAVGGGWSLIRNWREEGCVATVEYDSSCLSNDACILINVMYSYLMDYTHCRNGKTQHTLKYIETTKDRLHRYKCTVCGYECVEQAY